MTATVSNFGDGLSFIGAGPTDSPIKFTLLGGQYTLAVAAGTWGSGSIDFQVLMPDGSTFVSILTAPFAANGSAVVEMPPGKYAIVIATATGVSGSLLRVPRRLA